MADETQLLDDDRLLSVATSTPTTASSARTRGLAIGGGVIGGATATLRSMMLRSGGNTRGFVPPASSVGGGSSGGRAEEVVMAVGNQNKAAPPSSRGLSSRLPLPTRKPATTITSANDEENDDDEFSVELKALEEEGDRLFAIPAAAEAAEGRITAQLSSRVTTPDDTPSAECTHHTAASHISATQEDDNEVRGGGDDADDDDLMHEETMDGATRPTHHYAVGDDSPAESAQVPPPVPTAFEEVAVTPSSPAPLAVMVVAASLPNSLHTGSRSSSDATTTTASSSGPNPLLPSLLPPTCESRHHDDPLLSTDAAHSAAVAQKQHQPPLPQQHHTQLTYGGTLLVQDLSPCDLEIHSSSIVPVLDNEGAAAAVNSAVLGGVGGGGNDGHHRSPSLSRHRQPVVVGRVSPPAGSPPPPPPRETLPATLDDGMPRIGHIVLAFSDSDMREYNDEEQQSTAADPQVESTKAVSHIAPREEVIVVAAIDPEQEVELIASEEGETDGEGSTPTYSSDSSSAHAEVDDGVADDAASVPQQELLLLPHQQQPAAVHNDGEEDDAPLFKQQERMSSSAALAVASNSSKKHLASSQVKALVKYDQQQQGYQPGDQVEARWGASWYPAVVVSVLGKAVEVRWLKDNSTVHMTIKHVRRPKVSKSISTPNTGASHTTAASSDGGQPVHRLDDEVTPNSRSARSANNNKFRLSASDALTTAEKPPPPPTTSSVSPLPRDKSNSSPSTSTKKYHTSTQLVRLMEEEDELEQQQQLLRKKPSVTPGATTTTTTTTMMEEAVTPSLGGYQRSLRDTPSGHISGATTDSRVVDHRTGSTTVPRSRRHRSDSPTGNETDSITQPQHHSSAVMDEDFGDTFTPPSALLYFSPAALAELPPETRSRCKRDIPRVMIVLSLRDVVSWAMNSNFQTNVPFVMLLSRSKLLEAAGGADSMQASEENHNNNNSATQEESVAKEQQALIIATALGVTALDLQWISQTLQSLSRGGATVAHEPYVLPPGLAQPRLGGADPLLSSTTARSGGSSSLTVRLFPIPKTLRAFFNDVVWCPGKDVAAELIIHAAGGRVVRDVSETIAIIDELESKKQQQHRNMSSSTAGIGGGVSTSSTSSLPVSSIALYVPPGGRVGSALREPKLAALLQLDFSALQRTVVTHFQCSICTRPVSFGGGGAASSTPSPAFAGRTTRVAAATAAPIPSLTTAVTNRFLSMEDSQQAIPPLLRRSSAPLVGGRKPPSPPLLVERTPVVAPLSTAATPAAATPPPNLPPASSGGTHHMLHHQGMHAPTFQRPLPLQEVGSYSQPLSVTGRTLRSATGGNALRHRRWAHEQTNSQPPITHQHPQQHFSSSKFVGPILDEELGGRSNSTNGNVSITIGDDFYFYLPTTTVDGGDHNAVLDNGASSSTVGIGRVSAIAEDGEHVIMRTYEITSVTIHRRHHHQGPIKRPREMDDTNVDAAGGARGGVGGRATMQRLTTMSLTDEYVTVSPRMLDLDTPLFVVDEHLQDHLYILERPNVPPPPPPQPPALFEHSLAGGALQPVPEVIPVRVMGLRKYVEVGTVVGFRPSPGSVGGDVGLLRGVVTSFQRDSAVPEGLFIVVEFDAKSKGTVATTDNATSANDEESAQGVPSNVQPQRAVITADMIVDVFAVPTA